MKTIKKFGVTSYTSLLAIVLSIVSLILYVINSNLLYFRNLNASVVTFTIIAIVLLLANFVAALFVGDKWYLTFAQVLAAIFIMVALKDSIVDRSTAIGYVWFSNLEADNPAAVYALNSSVIFWATYLIALIGVIVGSFFDYLNKGNKCVIELKH